jgi:hypothetical protein
MVVAVENAVDLLQERLLEVSDEIMRELSLLEHNIEAVPAEGRAALLMAVMQITSTQRSLREHTDHIPSAWQRLDALRATVEMLEATLDHLSKIANQHLHSTQGSPAPRALLLRRRGLRRRAEPQGLLAKSLERSRHVLNGAWLRLLGLLVMLLAGAAISYGMFPEASQRGAAVNPIETGAPSVANVSGDAVAVSPAPASRGAIEGPAPLPVSPSTPSKVIEEPAPVRSLNARPASRDPSGGVEWPMPGAVVAMQSPPPPTPVQRGVGAEPEIAPTLEPELVAALPGSSGFVPVVFTHRNGAVANRAFAELQQRYPKVLGHRRGEPQPVDLGSKGVWHRLVVLPPGSRSDATKLCDRLVIAGYDRCWVKAY